MTRKRRKNSRRPSGWLAVLAAIGICYAFGVYEKKLPVPERLVELAERIPRPRPSATALETGGAGTGHTLALPAPIEGRKEVLLHHTGYTVSYNPDWKIPNWVAWELTRTEAAGTIPRDDCFAEDPTFHGAQATLDDYRGSGYSRGHMVPAADMRWSREAMEDCFYLTNMCPQKSDFNAGNWSQLERQCRAWAKRDSAILIVCGPLVGRSPKRIGRGGVVVPDGFFKVVLAPYAAKPRAIGFIYTHRNRKGARLQEFMATVDAVEKRTGIDFFPSLPDAVERKVEAQNPALHWSFPKRRGR